MDGLGNTVTFEYDSMVRLTKTGAEGMVREYAYDKVLSVKLDDASIFTLNEAVYT